jgi:D-sedoheptulose 7-phosphate isomerase
MSRDETFSDIYLRETVEIISSIDRKELEAMAGGLAEVRANRGRLFILGVGGSAAHAGHAAADFRKLCGFEAYAPTDNISELTARVNDEGWATVFSEWLSGSRISAGDAILVFSVGGGDKDRNISVNIVEALDVAGEAGAKIFGIVGRDGGATRSVANASMLIPPLVEERVTPHTEGLAAVMWHLLVSHPLLQRNRTKWESVT